MTLTPAQVKTAVIIGKYGGCLPACDNGAMISGWFNLAGCRVTVAVVRGGGTIPMAPGEIQNFYTPVDDAGEWWVRIDDLDPFKKPKRLVKVEVEFKDKKTEKVYLVSERSGYNPHGCYNQELYHAPEPIINTPINRNIHGYCVSHN